MLRGAQPTNRIGIISVSKALRGAVFFSFFFFLLLILVLIFPDLEIAALLAPRRLA